MMTGTKSTIKIEFERIANLYVDALCELFELDKDEGWWVGNYIGGVYCNGDLFHFTFQEIRCIVDNKISKDVFLEHDEYIDFCMEFNKTAPNLESWINGCPRYSKDDMQHLRNLKRKYDIAMYDFMQAKNKLSPLDYGCQ